LGRSVLTFSDICIPYKNTRYINFDDNIMDGIKIGKL